MNDFNGWAGNWPGAIGMYRNVTLKRYPTCVVLNATPYVFLPSVSRNDIENGTATSEVPFQISFKCQNAMVSGTGNNQTALGILASPGHMLRPKNWDWLMHNQVFRIWFQTTTAVLAMRKG